MDNPAALLTTYTDLLTSDGFFPLDIYSTHGPKGEKLFVVNTAAGHNIYQGDDPVVYAYLRHCIRHHTYLVKRHLQIRRAFNPRAFAELKEKIHAQLAGIITDQDQLISAMAVFTNLVRAIAGTVSKPVADSELISCDTFSLDRPIDF